MGGVTSTVDVSSLVAAVVVVGAVVDAVACVEVDVVLVDVAIVLELDAAVEDELVVVVSTDELVTGATSHTHSCQLPSAQTCEPAHAFSPEHILVVPEEHSAVAQALKSTNEAPTLRANQAKGKAMLEIALRGLELARVMFWRGAT